jgi:ParB-like chromosome segregation protein Spo0J
MARKKTPTKKPNVRSQPKSADAAAIYVDVGRLRPWADNPRLNEGEPVRKVAESIKRFGFGAPIIARAANWEIIAGHTRWLAAKKLRLAQVPVRVLDLDEQSAHLLALADNRLGELAQWDAALTLRLQQLKPEDVRLAGWSQADVDRLTAELLSATGIDDDDAPRLDRPGVEISKEVTCPNCQHVFSL